MSTLFGVLLLVGFMFAMSKLGMGCCGGGHNSHGSHGSHSGPRKQNESSGSCCGGHQKNNVTKLHENDSLQSEKTFKDDFKE